MLIVFERLLDVKIDLFSQNLPESLKLAK